MLHRNAFCGLALLGCSGVVSALELGFESMLSVDVSDNVTGEFTGDEIEGQVGYMQFGVFGEQKGTMVNGAFSGELSSQRRLDDPDSSFNAITQFLGAVDIQITPRSFSWYVGDILGTVRFDDGLQSIDEAADARRNVFVTGPQFTYEIDSFSRFNARFLYVNQAQDDVTLESLYNTSADWSFDTDRGNTWGTSVTNIYTDNPAENLEGDFNRFSLTGDWSRSRGRNSYDAQLGGTRYDTEEQSLNGVNARFSLERQLGPQTLFSVALSRDLSDQTLSEVESLLDTGTGRQADGDGFFDETRIDVRYGFLSSETTFDIGVGAGLSDFRLLTTDAGFTDAGDDEDRTNYFVSTNYSHTFTPRTSIATSLSFEMQDYNNRPDNTQSVLGEALLIQRLSRSFEVRLGYRVNVSDGQARDLTGTVGEEGELENIDSIENRATFALRWAPPTRASKDLTVELKSLLR